MRKLILTLALVVATIVGTQAQTKGDWYVGTGDVANIAWTDWAVSPTVGYGVMDNLMVGLSVSQADSTVDMEMSSPEFSEEAMISSRRVSLTPSVVSNGAISTIQFPSGIWAFHLPSSSVMWDRTHPDSVLVIFTR